MRTYRSPPGAKGPSHGGISVHAPSERNLCRFSASTRISSCLRKRRTRPRSCAMTKIGALFDVNTFWSSGRSGTRDALPDKPACGEACYSEVVNATEAHVGEVLVDEGDVVCAIEFLIDILAD